MRFQVPTTRPSRTALAYNVPLPPGKIACLYSSTSISDRSFYPRRYSWNVGSATISPVRSGGTGARA